VASYRIVCTEQVPATNHPRNAKIVAVGTGNDPDKATQRWTVSEVVSAMDSGNAFYTKGRTSGKVARVEKYWCGSCNAWHIRSSADAVTDNNLDSLRGCRW
jgi:hypothetical protein